MRDHEVPYLLNMFNRREVFFTAFAARSFENARRVREDLFGVQNNRKRYDGYLAALLDPEIDRALKAREQKLRDAMTKDTKWKGTLAASDRIKKAQEEAAKILPVYNYYETFRGRATAT